MSSLRRRLVLAICIMTFATNASAQEAAGAPAVVLMQIPASVRYPPIAESALVSGKVDVRVAVRPDGSVAEVTVFPRADAKWPLLFYGTVVDAAARASFDCRGCTQPSTPHTITFVFSFDGSDSAGNPLPPSWKQTGDANSEVIVFGRVPICDHCPGSEPPPQRAARCLWLWHCSK